VKKLGILATFVTLLAHLPVLELAYSTTLIADTSSYQFIKRDR
jgi:hypothetical protein